MRRMTVDQHMALCQYVRTAAGGDDDDWAVAHTAWDMAGYAYYCFIDEMQSGLWAGNEVGYTSTRLEIEDRLLAALHRKHRRRLRAQARGVLSVIRLGLVPGLYERPSHLTRS